MGLQPRHQGAECGDKALRTSLPSTGPFSLLILVCGVRFVLYVSSFAQGVDWQLFGILCSEILCASVYILNTVRGRHTNLVA